MVMIIRDQDPGIRSLSHQNVKHDGECAGADWRCYKRVEISASLLLIPVRSEDESA